MRLLSESNALVQRFFKVSVGHGSLAITLRIFYKGNLSEPHCRLLFSLFSSMSQVCLSSFRPTIRVVVQIYSNLGRIIASLRERNKFPSTEIGQLSANVDCINRRTNKTQQRLGRETSEDSDRFCLFRQFYHLFGLEITQTGLIASAEIRYLGRTSLFKTFSGRMSSDRFSCDLRCLVLIRTSNEHQNARAQPACILICQGSIQICRLKDC